MFRTICFFVIRMRKHFAAGGRICIIEHGDSGTTRFQISDFISRRQLCSSYYLKVDRIWIWKVRDDKSLIVRNEKPKERVKVQDTPITCLSRVRGGLDGVSPKFFPTTTRQAVIRWRRIYYVNSPQHGGKCSSTGQFGRSFANKKKMKKETGRRKRGD